VAKRLYEAKNKFEQAKRETIELKQRVFYNKPLLSFNSIQITSTDNNGWKALWNNEEKSQRQKYLDLMSILFVRAESKFFNYRESFSHEYSQMQDNHRNLIKGKGMTTTLTNLIDKRLTNITDRWRDIGNYKLDYYIRNSYGDLDHMIKNGYGQISKKIAFSSLCLIIDNTIHPFNNKQLKLLNRGPTYVPPCQMHMSLLSSSDISTMESIVKKQYAPLKHHLASLFSKHKVNIAIQMDAHKDIFEQYRDLFAIAIPSTIRQRTLYEIKLVQMIRLSLKNNNLLLRRTADHMNTFYLGNLQEFQAKADQYITKSNAYKLVMTLNDESDIKSQLHHELNDMIDSINVCLEILNKRHAISDDLYDHIRIDQTKVQMSHIYFLPDVSKVSHLSFSLQICF